MENTLIDLLNTELKNHFDYVPLNSVISIAQKLIENGVIAPPCKVGDKVYLKSVNNMLHELTFKELECGLIFTMENEPLFLYRGKISEIGIKLFLSKEEAEKALKGGED